MTLTGMGAAMARGQMAADGVICGTGEVASSWPPMACRSSTSKGDPVEAQAFPALTASSGRSP
jgi:hypothetical protein